MMKTSFSRVVALATLVCAAVPVWAQPPAPVIVEQPKPAGPKFTQSNVQAIALIGAFYTRMRRAENYSGRLVITKTILKDGNVVATRLIDSQSSWMHDKKQEDVYEKTALSLLYAVKEDRRGSVDYIHIVEDGSKKYTYYQSKSAWSELDQPTNNIPFQLSMTNAAMSLGLVFFTSGQEFIIDRKITNGQDKIVVGFSPENQFVFDARTGNLLSLNISNAPEKTEFRWVDTEFDVPLPESLFEWKVPEGATQVAPGETVVNVQF